MWSTTVVEFVAPLSTSDVTLEMHSKGTHGYGDVVTVGLPKCDLQVFLANGQPAAGVAVLVRDGEATLPLTRWYKTDTSGQLRIELVDDPTIVIVLFEKMLTRREISKTGSAVIRLSVAKAP